MFPSRIYPSSNASCSKLFRLLLATLCLLTASKGTADQDSFDRAVATYTKGFKECVDSNSLRGKDIAQAKEKYELYLKYRDEAIAIDQSILTSTERSMQKNLRYCEKVNSNLLSAEATPILEQALDHCDQAKNAVDEGNLDNAKAQYAKYTEIKGEALSVTETVMEVFALSSRDRQCSRVEGKIQKMESELQAQEEAAQALIALLNQSNDACQTSKALIVNGEIPLDSLNNAQKNLKSSETTLDKQKNHASAIDLANKYPDRESSKQIVQIRNTGNSCIEEVEKVVKKADDIRDDIIKSIKASTSNADKAFTKCKSAETTISRPTIQMSELDAAIEPQTEAKTLRNTVENSSAYKNATRYPKWSASKQLLDAVRNTRKCETNVSKTYAATKKRLANEIAEAKRKEKEAAERALKEQQRLKQIEEAKREAEKQKRLAEEQAREEEEARIEEERIAAEIAKAKEDARIEAERFAREQAEAEERARKEEEKERKKAERRAAREKAAQERAERGESDRGGLGGYRKSRLEQLEERRRLSEETQE